MTAEEVALEEFRHALRGARVARRDASHGSRIAFGMHASKRDAVRAIARIIRAIRAEREERGDMVGAFGQGIRTAYETGRRDALRGVQGACFFEWGQLGTVSKRSTSLEIGYDNALTNIAYAAEEAAR